MILFWAVSETDYLKLDRTSVSQSDDKFQGQ